MELKDMKIDIIRNEYGIQKTGPSDGTPSYFIELPHCPLNCLNCSKNNINESNISKVSLEELLCNLESINGNNIVLKGGEPLQYFRGGTRYNPHLCAFIEAVNKYSHIEIETSGIRNIFEIKTTSFMNILDELCLCNGNMYDFIIYPKLDTNVYPKNLNVTFDDIIRYFFGLYGRYHYGKYTVGITLNFMYKNEHENLIMEFLNGISLDGKFDVSSILVSMIPDIESENNIDVKNKICQECIDFCLKTGFQYAPVLQVKF